MSTESPPISPAGRIKAKALELGFDAAGIARVGHGAQERGQRVDPRGSASGHGSDEFARYEAWLAAGRHGEMAYLASDRHRERRDDPERVLPGVRAIVCVAMCYEPRIDEPRARRLGRIARYAGGEDYHRIMRERLRALEQAIRDIVPGARALGYSDTGAILERDWARRAGLGWIARNTCLISPTLGSYFLLGEVLVDRDLDTDTPFALEHCGTCRRCQDACPTGAIVAPQQLDARRCISYLTIELRGPIPRELRPLVGDWIFGCDICQDVCPWNRFAPPAREARLHARTLEGWTLAKFLELDDEGFRRLFETSPIKRAKRAGFLRNVCVALGNRGDADAIPALIRALDDSEALVRGHAAWALGEIGRRHSNASTDEALNRRATHEPDAWVRDEIAAAMNAPPRG